MTDFLIAERYANALSAALPDDGDIERASASLLQISELFSTHHELHSCLANPAIEVHLREQVLDEPLGLACRGGKPPICQMRGLVRYAGVLTAGHQVNDSAQAVALVHWLSGSQFPGQVAEQILQSLQPGQRNAAAGFCA